MAELEQLTVLSEEKVREVREKFGTPTFVYSEQVMEEQAKKALAFPNAHGLTVRYAMKALPNRYVVHKFNSMGIQLDASSGYEANRAINEAKVPASDILLTAQDIPKNLQQLVRAGVQYNACSLRQLQKYGELFPNTAITVRINPGLGSGGNNRTNTGGPASSFGIWHKSIDTMLSVAKHYGLHITRVHTHIGSGSDPEVWKQVALTSLENVANLLDAGHDVNTLNLGGGYKIGRMIGEPFTDLQECGEPVKQAFADFAQRNLKLEIEPGTFLVGNAGILVTEVTDSVSTSNYNFIKIDSGMTEISRPSLYGAQHPIIVVPKKPGERNTKEYIVVGHCCESGDILTPVEGDPEALQPRTLLQTEVGDLLVVEGAGAYCASMSNKNYNTYPEAAEVFDHKRGKLSLIRKKQKRKQISQNEIPLEALENLV